MAQKEVYLNANKSLLENVNEKSDATLVKSFWDEFQALMKSYKQLYLADALEDLHFFEMTQRTQGVRDEMRRSKNNILICSNVQGQSYLKDIQHNLFKVFCAILNLRTGHRVGNIMDDNLLNQYLDQIDFSEDMLEQFNVIKNLINRPEFFLNDKQTLHIHQRFKNMCVKRKQFVYNEKKMLNGQRADNEMYPV